MADATARVVGPVALTNAAATVYTVPASTVLTLRNIHVANETFTTTTFTLSIGTDGAGKRLFYQQTVLATDTFDWTGNIVLSAAELIQAFAATASALTLTISGVLTT